MKRYGTGTAGIFVLALTLGLVGCSDGGPPAPGDVLLDGGVLETEGSVAPTDTVAPGVVPDDAVMRDTAYSWEDALAEAQNRFSGDPVSIELELDGGRYEYRVELVSETESYELDMDADSGDVVDEDTDSRDDDREVLDIAALITLEDAADIARGVHDGSIVEWKLEGAARGPVYEFELIISSSQTQEVTIDAITGEVLDR